MSNPVLNKVSEASRSGRGFAAMDHDSSQAAKSEGVEITPTGYTQRVTIDGVIMKTASLGLLGGLSAYIGWQNPNLAGLILPMIFISLALAVVTMFKPFVAKITAPLYALCQGFVLGVISVIFNSTYPGIARDALGISGATFAVLLFAYSRGWVSVTAKMRSVVSIATFGIMVYYLFNLASSLIFGSTLPLIWDNSAAGIGFSLAVAGLAAWNFLLDFDVIERSVRDGSDSRFEWALALGIAVTFAWLYLEMLRLLSKLRSR
jgi:uncharacterized YccA/Bax inhibitor family protein